MAHSTRQRGPKAGDEVAKGGESKFFTSPNRIKYQMRGPKRLHTPTQYSFVYTLYNMRKRMKVDDSILQPMWTELLGLYETRTIIDVNT